MDAAEYFKIKVQLNDIEHPFSLSVKRNTKEEEIFREAAKMINSYYNQYRSGFKGLDTTSCYAMVAFLFARLYIESSDSEKDMESKIQELESEIKAYLEKSK